MSRYCGANEAVLKAVVDGWRAQMPARGLATTTITARLTSLAGSSSSPIIVRGADVRLILIGSQPILGRGKRQLNCHVAALRRRGLAVLCGSGDRSG
jgi:hypothetical protein